ncbi:hypothetical protein VNO77_13292 [Canavalia gladiata]|uniref:Uncharacterized protein n=1 Tax=Canavalia gladiata TaxID=3824 RepID=A0AAN9QUX1_CANGL
MGGESKEKVWDDDMDVRGDAEGESLGRLMQVKSLLRNMHRKCWKKILYERPTHTKDNNGVKVIGDDVLEAIAIPISVCNIAKDNNQNHLTVSSLSSSKGSGIERKREKLTREMEHMKANWNSQSWTGRGDSAQSYKNVKEG